MRTRVAIAVLALLAVLLVAACGGGGGKDKSANTGGGSVPASADYTPTSSPGFALLASDPDGDPWKAANALLDKFPGRERLIAMIEQSLTEQKLSFEQDIKPALGAETGLGILSFQGDTGNAVAITKPADPAKFTALIDKLNSGDSTAKKAVAKQVGDWTVASDTQAALTKAAAAHDGTSLTDNATFSEGIAALPSDALVKLWFDGAALTGLAGSRTGGTGQLAGFGKLVSLAAAFTPHSDGAAFQVVSKTDRDITSVAQYSSELVNQVPSGVLAYLSFKGLDKAINAIAQVPAVKAQLAEIESQLGVSLAELAPLFGGEGAIYVRQGVPLPEITIALQQADEAAARTTADKLFTRIAPALNGQITTTTIEGVSVKQIKGEQFSLYYAVFDGKLVISDSTTAISGLKDSGDKLANDSVFKNARDAAGMPDSTAGFLYVNLKDTVPLVENFITSSGGNINPDVQANLEPLNSLLFYSTVDGPKATVAGFVGIE
jgi:hypothetical protein